MIESRWVGIVVPALLFACSDTSSRGQDAARGGAGGGTTAAPLPEVARSSLTYDSAPVVAPATEAALLSDLNEFGLRAFQRLAPGDQNFVVSPVSGFIALTMTSAGARGATADEMKAVLYPNVSLSEIHPATNRLVQRIRGYARPSADTVDGEKKVELNLANGIFVQNGMTLEPSFLDTLVVNYDAGVALVDYESDPNAAFVLVNNWVAKETNDRISHLLEPGVVDTWTRLVLVNALYLYSSWLTAFDPNATHAGTFHGINADGSADFMHAVRYPSYAAGTGWVGVDLPYYGDSLVWTAVLPDAGAFDTVKSSLDAAFLADFDASSQSEQVGLTIPKLRFAGRTVSWNDTLRALGMTTLFDAATSNLEGINALKPLYVKAALQQVFVELAEKGTEAAAATAVVVNTDGGVALPPPLAVVLDRPFFFFIRERGGPVLFAGQIVNLPAN